MHKALGVMLLALVLVSPAAQAKEAADAFTLKVGETRRVEVGELKRIALGDPSIADVRTAGSHQLELVGVSPGKTTLLVWLASGERKSYLLQVTGEGKAHPQTRKAQPPAPEVQGDTLTLQAGETRTLRVPGVTRVAVGDPHIADIQVDGKTGDVRVTGGRKGKTTLLVWTRSGDTESRQSHLIDVQ
jgi:Flp pilus assembly secretin CpaC